MTVRLRITLAGLFIALGLFPSSKPVSTSVSTYGLTSVNIPVSRALMAGGVTAMQQIVISAPANTAISLVDPVVGGLVFDASPRTSIGGPVASSGPGSLMYLNLANRRFRQLNAPRGDWAVDAVTTSGSWVMWVETSASPASSCADPSFGCYLWRLYAENLVTSSPRRTLLGQTTQPVPRRGVPEQATLTADQACWTTSADNTTWSVWTSTLGRSGVKRTASTASWLRTCQKVGDATYAINWRYADGTGDLVRFINGVRVTVWRNVSQMSFATGDALLDIRSNTSPTPNSQVVLLKLASRRASTLTQPDDTYGFGRVGVSHFWVNAPYGLESLTSRGVGTTLADASVALVDPQSNGRQLDYLIARPNGAVVRLFTFGRG